MCVCVKVTHKNCLFIPFYMPCIKYAYTRPVQLICRCIST